MATLHVIDRDGLLANATAIGDGLRDSLAALGHPLLAPARGQGLLIAVQFTAPVAAEVAANLLRLGFIVNAVAPDALRLAPPLILTKAQADSFVAALPDALDAVVEPRPPTEGAP